MYDSIMGKPTVLDKGWDEDDAFVDKVRFYGSAVYQVLSITGALVVYALLK